MTSPPELVILCHLAAHTSASATQIGTACAMSPGEVRGRLVMLEFMRLIAGRNEPTTGGRVRRVYVVTAEGRRRAGIVDKRTQDD